VSDRGARIVARGARFNGPLAGSVRAPGVPLVKRGSESRSVCQTGHASCGSTTRGVCERGNSGSERAIVACERSVGKCFSCRDFFFLQILYVDSSFRMCKLLLRNPRLLGGPRSCCLRLSRLAPIMTGRLASSSMQEKVIWKHNHNSVLFSVFF
jgi:hypothetical protein